MGTTSAGHRLAGLVLVAGLWAATGVGARSRRRAPAFAHHRHAGSSAVPASGGASSSRRRHRRLAHRVRGAFPLEGGDAPFLFGPRRPRRRAAFALGAGAPSDDAPSDDDAAAFRAKVLGAAAAAFDDDDDDDQAPQAVAREEDPVAVAVSEPPVVAENDDAADDDAAAVVAPSDDDDDDDDDDLVATAAAGPEEEAASLVAAAEGVVLVEEQQEAEETPAAAQVSLQPSESSVVAASSDQNVVDQPVVGALSSSSEPPPERDVDALLDRLTPFPPPAAVVSSEDADDATGTPDEADVALTALAGATLEDFRDAGMLVDDRLGEVPSHQLVEVDDDGDPVVDRDRMVFVDEATCIGCTNCACIAPQTFVMEEAHGRARAVRQDGDTEDTIAEAIATCPVDCIHWVPWDELVALESTRDEVMQSYNFKGRLVGNDGLLSTNGAGPAILPISSNNAARCGNCPTNGCPDCPMFSVGDAATLDAIKATRNGNGGANGLNINGPVSAPPPSKFVRKRCGNCPTNGCVGCPVAAENPEHQKRRVRREVKRRQRTKARQDEIRQQFDDAEYRPVDL